MFAAPDHDTNNEADFQDSYTNLIIGAHTNHHINHSPAVTYYNPNNLNNTQPVIVVSTVTLIMSENGPTLSINKKIA